MKEFLCEEFERVVEAASIQMLKNAQKQNFISEQWAIILENPVLFDLSYFPQILTRVCLAPISECGCEQSSSKYNRAKNKLSSVMGRSKMFCSLQSGVCSLVSRFFEVSYQARKPCKKKKSQGFVPVQ